jgi:xanthine dehydrogenase YagR molybdenum-binding subunit
VALGATRDGQLLAIRHTSVTPTSRFDGYVEYAAIGTRTLYACPAIATQHRVVRVHRGIPTPMRAPHEGLSMFGLECAMDELAVQLGMDPVALRLKNYAETDPTSGKPFSSKALRDCYSQGAERFGWERRTPAPGSMRDGRDLVGWGMASALMSTFRFPAAARVTLEKGGTVLIEMGTQEIGTGVYTIMPQIAADVLGLPVERVRLVLGDTMLPEAGGTFGSSTPMGVGSAVHDAATRLKAQLPQLTGGRVPDSPAAYDALLAQHTLDRVSAESAWSPGTPVERIGLDAGVRALSAEGAWSPGTNASPLGEVPEWSMHTFGAVFVEVRVDADLCIPRLSRCVGVYSAGRSINPKTARSQMLGGIIWGVGQALLEHSAMDHGLGRYLSKNLSGYLVPVNADIPELDVSFVDEFDAHASALGAKGIGELGAVGVGPAIANAVWHATGIRVRELPITPEALLASAARRQP